MTEHKKQKVLSYDFQLGHYKVKRARDGYAVYRHGVQVAFVENFEDLIKVCRCSEADIGEA